MAAEVSMQPIFAAIIASLGASETGAPEGWTTFSPRDETAPRFFFAYDTKEVAPGYEFVESHAAYSLGIAGRGEEACDGRWVKSVPATAGGHHAFRARFSARNVADLDRCILARVVWLDAGGKQVGQPEYAVPERQEGALTGAWRAPEGAASARIELHLRWTAEGEVLWSGIRFGPCDPPKRARSGSPR